MSMEHAVWHALVVRPRSEKSAAKALASRGVETYLPVYRGRYRSGGRFKDVDLPLFPQYLFCRIGAWSHAHILSAPGVFRFVAFGSTLAAVDTLELQNVRRVVDSAGDLRPWPYLRGGDLVEIAEGPLRGMVGRLTKTTECMLVLELSLLQRSIAVKVERRWVRPVSITANDFPGSADSGSAHSMRPFAGAAITSACPI